jgi:VanZ family protein
MFVFTEIGRKIYRPYIYSNQLFDFWIADTIGNFTGTIAIIFFDLAGMNPEYKKGKNFIFIIVVGLIVYELLQFFSPRSICDWRDMIATLIAGSLSLIIYNLINIKDRNPETLH